MRDDMIIWERKVKRKFKENMDKITLFQDTEMDVWLVVTNKNIRKL